MKKLNKIDLSKINVLTKANIRSIRGGVMQCEVIDSETIRCEDEITVPA